MFEKTSKNLLTGLLLLTTIIVATACGRVHKTLCEYEEDKCAYFSMQETRKYKYKDYIVDDVSNGGYLLATPNIADYRTGATATDEDMQRYGSARMDFALKKKMIEENPKKVKDMCDDVKDGFYEETNHLIYFEDKENHRTTLLNKDPAVNLIYNDKIPSINFTTINEDDYEYRQNLKKHKILLSDLIISNSSPADYLYTIFRVNKEIIGYYKDMKIDTNAKNNAENAPMDMAGAMPGMMPGMMPETTSENTAE